MGISATRASREGKVAIGLPMTAGAIACAVAAIAVATDSAPSPCNEVLCATTAKIQIDESRDAACATRNQSVRLEGFTGPRPGPATPVRG